MPELDKSEDKKDESEEKKEEVLDSLDAVHDRVVADLENEDSDEKGDDDGEEDKSGDNADDTADSNEDEPAADDGDNKDSKEEEPQPDPQPEPEVPAPDTQPAVELEVDTTKNAPGKIAVKDFDDKTHYFNDLDEVPEDFEPKSYKEWGRAVQKFTDKEQSDRKAAEDAQVKAIEDEKAARIKGIKDDWDRDIKTLTDNKTLPEDTKERQTVVNAVFDVMNEKLARGKVIDFETGYEIYASKKGADDKKEVIDKTNKDKKTRGGMVAGAGSSPSVKPKVIEGPPPGVSLDDVHEQVLNSL